MKRRTTFLMVWNDPAPRHQSARGPVVSGLGHKGGGRSMIKATTIGLDVAIQIFQIHVVSTDGKVTVKRQLRRSQALGIFGKLTRCIVGLEACGRSHFWAREIR